MRNYFKYAPAIAALSLFSQGGPVFYNFITSEPLLALRGQHQSIGDLTSGKTAGRLERIFKDEMPIRSFSTGALNAISLGIFGQARKGIVAGSDNWFFSREELSWSRRSPEIISQNISFAKYVRQKLNSNGVQLIVVLVPEKADIYRDKLGSIRAPETRMNYYNEIYDRLKTDAGVQYIPDLRVNFLGVKDSSQLYFKSDTHWTVSGSAIAAKLVAEELAGIPNADQPKVDYIAKLGKDEMYSGDLYKFEELSVFSSWFNLPLEKLTPITAVENSANADDIFSDTVEASKTQTAVIGTSYSANPKWSFVEQLKIALRADVVNLSKEGQGPFAPMKNFLDNDITSYPAIEFVVWEIPVRYFDEIDFVGRNP